MSDPRPRVRLDTHTVAAGEAVEVRALITHPMETGNREGPDGNLVPRDIIRTFRASFEGETVFEARFDTAISANPFLQFNLAPRASGTLTLVWTDEAGRETTATETITVT